MTVMTLMTMKCGCFLERGAHPYFVGLYSFALEHLNSAIQAVLILLVIERITPVTTVTTFWKGVVDIRWGHTCLCLLPLLV
jgi:hypothetical protein